MNDESRSSGPAIHHSSFIIHRFGTANFVRSPYFSQSGQASGGQSGGQSRQHSEVGQHDSGAVTCAGGACDTDLPVRLEAASAPAATSGIAASENHNHFLLLMGSPCSKMAKNTSRSLTPILVLLFKVRRLSLRGLNEKGMMIVRN